MYSELSFPGRCAWDSPARGWRYRALCLWHGKAESGAERRALAHAQHPRAVIWDSPAGAVCARGKPARGRPRGARPRCPRLSLRGAASHSGSPGRRGQLCQRCQPRGAFPAQPAAVPAHACPRGPSGGGCASRGLGALLARGRAGPGHRHRQRCARRPRLRPSLSRGPAAPAGRKTAASGGVWARRA